jgi:hypothetical protein
MDTKAVPKPDLPEEQELAPQGTPPHIAVALGLLDQEHAVIREPGESDESYQSRCELLRALIDHAKNH